MNLPEIRGLVSRLLPAGLLLALSTPLSGCFLMVITGAAFNQDGSLITTIESDSALTTCVNSGFTVECTYFIRDENGVPVSVISSADLISEFGFLGVLIDPLILQVPGNADSFVGTFNNSDGVSGDLVIRSGFKSIPADTYQTMIADPGTQFVIAELPPGTDFDGLDFSFSLSFAQPEGSPTPVPVKPLLTIRFDVPGNEFYIPFLPCTTDLASLPAVEIPAAATPQPLALPASLQPCTGQQYALAGFGVDPCDFDGDSDVDRDDIVFHVRARNAPALPGDRLDANADGWIDINDARRCALQCNQPQCQVAITPFSEPRLREGEAVR